MHTSIARSIYFFFVLHENGLLFYVAKSFCRRSNVRVCFQIFLTCLYFCPYQERKSRSRSSMRLRKVHCLYFTHKMRTREGVSWDFAEPLFLSIGDRLTKINKTRIALSLQFFFPRPIYTSRYAFRKTAAVECLQYRVDFMRRPHDQYCYSKAQKGIHT